VIYPFFRARASSVSTTCFILVSVYIASFCLSSFLIHSIDLFRPTAGNQHQLGISATEINIQLYNPDYSNANNYNSANGKALLTYDPNVFSGGASTRAAYQVWAGYLILNGAIVSPNSQINSPFMSDWWTPNSNDKRDTGSYMDFFNLTGWS
jgi:hypothetical protein